MLWLALHACAPTPAVAPPAIEERLAPGAPMDRDLPGPVGPVARAAGVEVWAERPATGGSTVLWIADDRGRRVLVDDGGEPDRPALSPDGRTVAWVSAASGLASVWTLDLAGGAPVQRTNRGLRPPGTGGPPAGWVPPPRAAPRFEGADLAWEAPDGPHRLRVAP